MCVHPHILKCYGKAKCYDGSWILLLQFAAHGDLESYYSKLGVKTQKDGYNLKGIGLSMGERLEFVNQLMQAVRHVHHLGVIHRDLKPTNILVSAQKTVLLGDFGATTDVKHSENSGL